MLDKFSKHQYLLFLKEWLLLLKVSVLDTSYCNVKQRELFLSHLSTGDVVFHGHESEYLTEYYLLWICRRNMRIGNWTLNQYLSRCTYSESFVYIFQNIGTLSLRKCSNSLECITDLIAFCSNLTEITLSESDFVNDVTILRIATHCPKLIKCNFSRLPQLTDDSIIVLSAYCKQLTSVDLSDCESLTDIGIVELTRNCTNLEALNISVCQISDTTLKSISVSNQSLTFLSLGIRSSTDITTSVVENLIKNCLQLRTFHLTFHVTDSILNCIATHLPHITDLDISSSESVTDVGITSLCNGCKQIQKLSMCLLQNITIKSIITVCTTQSQLTNIKCFQGGGGDGYDYQLLSVLGMKFVTLSEASLGMYSMSGQTRVLLLDDFKTLPQQLDINEENKSTKLHKYILNILPKCTHTLTDITLPEHCIEQTLEVIFTQCPNLTCIDLYWVHHIVNDSTLFIIGSNCNLLQELTINDSVMCTDAGTCEVIRNNHNLTILNCKHCVFLTNLTLCVLSLCCPYLKLLSMSHSMITNYGVETLTESCHKLCELYLTDCNELTDIESLTATIDKNCKFIQRCECTSKVYRLRGNR